MKVLPNGEEVPLEEATEVSKSTTQTLMAGERIMEALDISVLDQQLSAAYADEIKDLSAEEKRKVGAPSRNPIFGMYGNVGPEQYVLMVVRKIQAASLHDALLVLPFGKVVQLIEHLNFWAGKVSHSIIFLRSLYRSNDTRTATQLT
jgi:U3 small nucleolar RNA-associated protein 12